MSAFRHLGGDILFGNAYLSPKEVQAQLDLFLREHDACLRLGDRLAARVARKAFLDLTDAIQQQARWRKASACLASAPNGRAL